MKYKMFFAMLTPALCFGVEFTQEQICKATIATVMLKQPSIMTSKNYLVAILRCLILEMTAQSGHISAR
jgi:hypothetical protein